MSILIKGMEMPQAPERCRAYMDFRIWNDGTVEARIGPKETEYKAVPVPPHGRLKDYDRIMKEYDEWFSKTESREYENMFYALHMAINGSPTIIPAEEG